MPFVQLKIFEAIYESAIFVVALEDSLMMNVSVVVDLVCVYKLFAILRFGHAYDYFTDINKVKCC